jgi:hypothetical protein
MESAKSSDITLPHPFPQAGENADRCEALSKEIATLAGHLNAAHHRFLKLIAEFDTRKGWNAEGCQSCAHWLNWKCGIAMGAAREKVRAAHALETLPKISAAMERGELSYTKVRELTRVADAATEDTLLMYAQHGTAMHVERIVRGFRRCKDAEELGREATQQAERSLSYRHDDDGTLVLTARIPAEAGALILKALAAATDALPKEDGHDVPAGTSTVKCTGSSFSQRRADALALMAESFLAHGDECLSGGDRHQVVVHVDVETLKESVAGRCEFEEGASMAGETARRIACDASVVGIVENDKGEPLNVGRKTRSIPPAMRRALNSRDQGCRFPGCCNKKYVDGHHIEHWAHGGETKLSNLVTLCRFHHHLVHEGGVSIQILDDGALRFIKPNGKSFDSLAPNHTQPMQWTDLTTANDDTGIHIDPRTAVTKFAGGPVDYGMAVDALLGKWRKGRPTASASRPLAERLEDSQEG